MRFGSFGRQSARYFIVWTPPIYRIGLAKQVVSSSFRRLLSVTNKPRNRTVLYQVPDPVCTQSSRSLAPSSLSSSSLDPRRSLPRLNLARLLPLHTPRIRRHAASCRRDNPTLAHALTRSGKTEGYGDHGEEKRRRRKNLPILNTGFKAGSCTINALAHASVILSA